VVIISIDQNNLEIFWRELFGKREAGESGPHDHDSFLNAIFMGNIHFLKFYPDMLNLHFVNQYFIACNFILQLRLTGPCLIIHANNKTPLILRQGPRAGFP
jgi:hypothetical protein